MAAAVDDDPDRKRRHQHRRHRPHRDSRHGANPLEEARKSGDLTHFAKEHPTEADRVKFMRLLDAMSQGVLEVAGTSKPEGGIASRKPAAFSSSNPGR